MIRRVESPHETAQQSAKLLADPSGYAWSPRVNTTSLTLATLSVRSTLSTSLAVWIWPWLPQTAMSPTPIITDAPLIATCEAGASAGAGVVCTGGLHENASSEAMASEPYGIRPAPRVI